MKLADTYTYKNEAGRYNAKVSVSNIEINIWGKRSKAEAMKIGDAIMALLGWKTKGWRCEK